MFGTCSDHSVRNTRRSACGYGSGRSRMALMTLKIAVLAPIPSASVATATKVKAGDFTSVRAAKRMSRQSSSIVDPPRVREAEWYLGLRRGPTPKGLSEPLSSVRVHDSGRRAGCSALWGREPLELLEPAEHDCQVGARTRCLAT